MSASATAAALDKRVQELTASRPQQMMARQASPQDAIKSNPIAAIMLADEKSPEQKRDEVAALLRQPGSTQALAEFEAYLQSVRERMETETIALSDTKLIAELKATITDFNRDLIGFEDKIGPLLEIVDAVDALLKNDRMVDAFREIQSDRHGEQEDAARAAELETLEQQLRETQGSLFGLGGVLRRIERLRHRAKEIADAAEAQGQHESALGEFAGQKQRLRELLDLSSEESQARQKDLVDSVLKFINTSKDRMGSIDERLGAMATQINRVYDANSRITNVYATLGEGINLALKGTEDDRQALVAPAEETALQRMTREEKKVKVEEHIQELASRQASAVETYADLTGSAVQIRTLRENNRNQRQMAATMRSRGIAAAAGHLNVALQAFGSAALEESNEVARSTLVRIIDRTNEITAKESMRAAASSLAMSDDVKKAAADLAKLGESTTRSAEVLRAGLTEFKQNLAGIMDVAQGVQSTIHDQIAIPADVAADRVEDRRAAPADDKPLGI